MNNASNKKKKKKLSKHKGVYKCGRKWKAQVRFLYDLHCDSTRKKTLVRHYR